MKRKPALITPRLLPTAWLLSLLIVRAGAQSAPEASREEEPVVLSPFTVSATTDVGYEASSSLAGTGLNTKLTDLGSSVSVVTSKFLEDTASTNLRETLVYQTNMETTGFGGNLSGAGPSPGGVVGEPDLTSGLPGTRVRGLASATQARNFYRNYLPMDSYNTDRVEINRGANALLFGVGSPAGIINTSTKAANLRTQGGSAELSAGSFGTWRAVLKYNHVLLKDELALHIAAVKGDEKFQQEFAHTTTERAYLAGGWDIKALRNRGILSSTTIRASYEKGEIEANRPRVLPPSDRISSWFEETLPENLQALGAKPKVSYDPRNGPFNAFNRALGTATIGVIDQVNRNPTFMFQDVNATAPRDNIPGGPGGQIVFGRPYVSNNVFYADTNKTGIAVGAYSRELSRVRSDYGLADQAFYTSENLTDPSIFDFFNQMLVGPNSEALSKFDVVDASIEQLLFDRTAGVELSFSRQTWEEGFQSLLAQARPYISIDVNTHMWTGEVNPNYGRPFISTAGAATYRDLSVETKRAKLFYKLDFEEKSRGRLGWILGKHVFSGLLQSELFEEDERTGGSVHYTPDFWLNSSQGRTAAQNKQIVAWVYLGPSMVNATTPAGANLPGLQQNLLNFQDEVNGKGVIISRLQAPNAAAAKLPAHAPQYIPINVQRETREVENTASSAVKSDRTLDSQAFSMQGNWLGDHLVSTVGWRKEKIELRSVNAPVVSNGEAYRLVHDPSYTLDNASVVPQEFEATLFAWSGVAKAPQKLLRYLPGISGLNVYYGESENFNPSESRKFDPFGVTIPPPSGTTEEFGVHVEAFDGKLSARINFYETTQIGDFSSGVTGAMSRIMSIHATAKGSVLDGRSVDGGNGFPPGYVAPPDALLATFQAQTQANGRISYSDPGVDATSDFVAKGTEIEVAFRPTLGLSFVLNVGKQESVRSNTAAEYRRMIFDTPTASGDPLATEWLKPWATQITMNEGAVGKEGTNDDNILNNNFQRFVLNPMNIAGSADGAVVHSLRKWRANLVGNYQFQSERLKGWGVGVGVRWQDKSALGYPVATFESDLSPSDGVDEVSDIRISDVRNPFYGPTETRYDGWLSYATTLTRRKIPVKFQLNVRNMFTSDELVPVVINPDAQVAVWSIAEGRRFTFTTRISF